MLRHTRPPSFRESLRACSAVTRLGAVLVIVGWSAVVAALVSLTAEFPCHYGSNPTAFAALTSPPVGIMLLSLACNGVSLIRGARSSADSAVRSEIVPWAAFGLVVSMVAPFLIALTKMGNL